MNRFWEWWSAHRQQALKWGLIGLGAVFMLWLIYLGTGYAYTPVSADTARLPGSDGKPKAVGAAARALEKIRPQGLFIIVDRYENRLWLRDGDKVLVDAPISVGAGSVLENPTKKEDWVFETPIGRHTVVNKRRNPLWTAPDWEYVESNQPLPKNYGDRVQDGMLGEYALDLNVPGYMIHGTLYSRLLGRSVSHGCIRVGRDDLRMLFKSVPLGTPVFIY